MLNNVDIVFDDGEYHVIHKLEDGELIHLSNPLESKQEAFNFLERMKEVFKS